MVFETAAKLLGYEVPKLTPNEYGIQFMDYMGLQLSNTHRVHQKMGKRYPLYSISHNGNTTEYNVQSHRMWLDNTNMTLDDEISFSTALRLTTLNESLETFYFQTARMKLIGNAYLLIIDRNAQDNTSVTYVNVQIPTDSSSGMNYQIRINELRGYELQDCIKFMKKIQSYSDIIIDPPPHFERFNTPIDLLKLTDKIKMAIKNRRNSIVNLGLFY